MEGLVHYNVNNNIIIIIFQNLIFQKPEIWHDRMIISIVVKGTQTQHHLLLYCHVPLNLRGELDSGLLVPD